MPNYRRLYVPGGTVFLTVVTHERRPLFKDPQNMVRLRQAALNNRRLQSPLFLRRTSFLLLVISERCPHSMSNPAFGLSMSRWT